jgi:hypothetical protein
MNNAADGSNSQSTSRRVPGNFWEVFLKDEQLSGCDNLEKLVAGCEVIAALDHIDELLAA